MSTEPSSDCRAASTEIEQLLRGPGAGGGVVRIGDTVRRLSMRMPSGAIATLRRLEALGFSGAPRYRGVDELNRHVLDFVEGEVAVSPLPPWVADDGLLVSVARLLREYHEALYGVRWDLLDLEWGYAPPMDYAGPLPCHLDVSPANVVCRDGLAYALIDFEEVALADVLWDLARTLRHWVPMLAPPDLGPVWAPVRGRQLERLALFLDAYGLDDDGRLRLPDALLANADATYNRMRLGAMAGDALYAQEYYGGHADRNRRARVWMTDGKAEITAATRGAAA